MQLYLEFNILNTLHLESHLEMLSTQWNCHTFSYSFWIILVLYSKILCVFIQVFTQFFLNLIGLILF